MFHSSHMTKRQPDYELSNLLGVASCLNTLYWLALPPFQALKNSRLNLQKGMVQFLLEFFMHIQELEENQIPFFFFFLLYRKLPNS